jgi:hypothetical protein
MLSRLPFAVRSFAWLPALCALAATPLPAPAGRELAANEPVSITLPIAVGGGPATPDATALLDPPVLANAAPVQALPPPVTGAPPPSPNVTINLIRNLVKRGLLPQEDADALLQQAEADAVTAREQTQAAQTATLQAAAQVAVQVAAQASDAPPAGDDAVRVTYIPEVVKAQMREQIKAEVMAQAREENWAAPRTMPEWAARFRVGGDIRVRYEADIFPDGNDNTGSFPNFNAINTGAPFDVSGTVFSPQLNVDQNRNRARLRARIGAEIEMGDGFTAGMRVATGDSNSPVSTNQSLGASGGNFSKYAIWLDRAYLKYEVGGTPQKNLAVSVGRFDNPFFSSEVTWDNDLGFDGAALAGKYQPAQWLTPFFAGGAFPVYNTDFNFSSNQPAKFKSDDKWLYGAQVGADLRAKGFTLKVAGAYYYFDNISGKLSTPYTPLNASDAGNTDNTRPSFAQKGNTYRPLRNIVPTADNNYGTSLQYQYFGLAAKFRELALTGRLDYDGYEPFRVSLNGEWVKNLAFDQSAINLVAVNNRGPNDALGGLGKYAGGDTAWIVNFTIGSVALDQRWNWNLGLNYRHVESDAVVDGFTDSDFGLGGTNLKGYTFYGNVALSPRVNLGLRWMSADEITGPPLKTDIFQVDINGKF